MQAPGLRPGSGSEISPGLGRRGFLSVGGGILAGAGTLTLPRTAAGLEDATGTARQAVRGLPPIYPADPRYATMRMGFNQRWVGSPAYIQVVRNARETVTAVQRAYDAGLRITVRGGGHCYENFSSGNYGGVIIDMSGMQGVHLDRAGQVCVEGGATLWNVYETLFKDYNLSLPGGSCYSVGAGGHIVGGGYGLLSRLHGLTVDYLVAVDVVCVDRRGRACLVRARKGDPETGRLLWAHTGGGGGNFGIVTAYYFARLPNPPVRVQLATTTWPWSGLTAQSFATLLGNYGRFMETNSSPASPFAGLFSLLHLYHHSAGHISMTTQAAGPAFGLLPGFLAQITTGVPGGTTTVQTLPWLQATQTSNGSGPNRRAKYKSAYMKAAFPDDQVRAIYGALTDVHYANPQALLQVDSYGCQVNLPPPDATAVAQRSSIMKLQYQTYWTSPEDDEVNLRWINRFYASVYAASGGVPASNRVTDGCFINYPDVDLPPSWPTLYYKASYPALQAVKARWDPRNVFHHAQSITPAVP
jgi:FAD/FMN-containing dehydrogenase